MEVYLIYHQEYYKILADLIMARQYNSKGYTKLSK